MFGDMLKKAHEELRPRLMAEGHEGLEFVVHKAHIPFTCDDRIFQMRCKSAV